MGSHWSSFSVGVIDERGGRRATIRANPFCTRCSRFMFNDDVPYVIELAESSRQLTSDLGIVLAVRVFVDCWSNVTKGSNMDETDHAEVHWNTFIEDNINDFVSVRQPGEIRVWHTVYSDSSVKLTSVGVHTVASVRRTLAFQCIAVSVHAMTSGGSVMYHWWCTYSG